MSEVNLSDLAQQIGLEELANISREEVATNFIPAAVAGLADGDIVVMHTPYAGRQAELYGEGHFGEGLVAKAVARTAIANSLTPGQMYDFQDFAAAYFTQPGSPYVNQNAESAVRIYPGAMRIDGHTLELPRKPSLIFDYGACLTGRSYIADQMGFISQGQRPFTYSPLTRLHFTNQVLIHTYDLYETQYGPDLAQVFVDNQLYIGREDGVADASDEIIRAQRTHHAPVDIADVILAAGAQHSTPADMKRGIENAHILLKEGGKLVVRALARPADDELGSEAMASWAYAAGFPERTAVQYEAALDQIGTLLLSGHFGEREIQTIVLTK